MLTRRTELRDNVDGLYRENTELRRQIYDNQQVTRRLVDGILRQQALLPAGFPRAFDPQDFVYLFDQQRRASMGEQTQPAIIVSPAPESQGYVPPPRLQIPSNANALYPGFVVEPNGARRRSNSYTSPVGSPMPGSEYGSPVGSPQTSPMPGSMPGSPLPASPLQEQLLEEESYEQAPKDDHGWVY